MLYALTGGAALTNEVQLQAYNSPKSLDKLSSLSNESSASFSDDSMSTESDIEFSVVDMKSKKSSKKKTKTAKKTAKKTPKKKASKHSVPDKVMKCSTKYAMKHMKYDKTKSEKLVAKIYKNMSSRGTVSDKEMSVKIMKQIKKMSK